jgi:Na+/melibiose symporter-like transporter
VAPLIYLGMEVIFFRLEDRFNKLKDKSFMNKLRNILISVIILTESIAIIMGPNFTMMGIILPIILIPSLLGIVYIFYMAYSLNRLTLVKPGILTISFFLYMLSNIFRPVMQNILGETASYIIVVEIVDIIIFMIIFLGLYKK